MTNLVSEGTPCQCSFGATPSAVAVSPTSTAAATNLKILTETMIVPNANIPPFGMCSSLGNPAVASATSANLGALTPQACTPSIVGPWAPAAASVTILGQGAVTVASKCNCAFGGVISFMQTPNAVLSSV